MSLTCETKQHFDFKDQKSGMNSGQNNGKLESTITESTDKELEKREIPSVIRITDAVTSKNNGTSRKWFVLVAGFFTNSMTIGFTFNMSVLYVEWLSEFGRSYSETALVQSVCSGMFFIGGVISGFSVTRFGPHRCQLFGGIITTIGFVASYFATSIMYLVVMLGVIPGFGLSLCHVSASTITGRHFNGKSKLLALSIITFGSGVGSIAFPICLEKAIELYAWRGTLLLIGGIMFNIVVCAGIYKSPPDHPKEHDNTLDKDRESTESDSKSQSSGGEKQNASALKTDSNNGLLHTLAVLFRNKSFVLYTISMALCISTFNSPLIFLIDFFQSKGILRADAVMIYLYMSIFSAISRLLPGLLKQIPHLSVLFLSGISALLGSITAVVFPYVGSSFVLNTIVACCFRIGHGSMIALMTISVVKLVGQDHYSAGIGITMTAAGIIQILSGPVSGYIRDVTGTYDVSFFSSSAVLFIAANMFFTTMVYRHYQKA